MSDAVVYIQGDVRSMADNERAVQTCVSQLGQLDVVVGNAGIWDYNVPLVDLPADDLAPSFDELFQINVLGYLNLAKASLTELAKTRGNMIFTVSNAGFWPAGGGVLYTATKHAVVGLVKQLAYECAPHIRVNGVAPGAISTQLKGPSSLGMQDRKFPGEAMNNNAANFIPVAELPSPAEYAGALRIFCQPHG